ncbi:MAG: galactokinase [Lentisphaeria bacterium]|nr:galactokinase [Lentisphaeria bacterium]
MRDLIKVFQEKFNASPTAGASAPGRLEILGNHTDYNEGIVLSCAVDQRTSVVMAANHSSMVQLYDLRAGESAVFDVQNLTNTIRPKWANYPAGVVSELQARQLSVGGFDAVISSNVPLSAGMSSSAAFETAILFGLMQLYKLDVTSADAARIGQGVENNFLGVKTGLLDQFSSIFGVSNSFILSDFRTVEVLGTIPMTGNAGILVVNSMQKHDLVDSAYNERRAACESAAAKLAARHQTVKTLRDVSGELLESEKSLLTDIEYRRAKHVVQECERVRRAVEYLKNNDLQSFGALWWESHESSRVNFENSTPALDKIVEFSHQLPGALGARLSGGGFGGITVHLVQNDHLAEYQDKITGLYKDYCNITPETIVCHPGKGAVSETLTA